MKLFKQHLNWTLFLAILISNVLVYYWGNLTPSGGNLDASVFLFIGAILLTLEAEIWYLKQKGRSLWNLCWNPLPYIGFIVIFMLENHKSKR